MKNTLYWVGCNPYFECLHDELSGNENTWFDPACLRMTQSPSHPKYTNYGRSDGRDFFSEAVAYIVYSDRSLKFEQWLQTQECRTATAQIEQLFSNGSRRWTHVECPEAQKFLAETTTDDFPYGSYPINPEEWDG